MIECVDHQHISAETQPCIACNLSIFRYWLILNDALAYMRNANITAEDSTIVLTKGDDDPKIRKDSKNKVRLSV